MWLLLKGLALRFAIGRTVGGMLAALFVLLLPIAGVLNFVGLPLLFVLGVLGVPVLLVLALIGLPILFVLGFGGILLLLLGILLTVGMLAIKVLLPIVLVVWFVRRMFGKQGGAVTDGTV